MQSWPFAVLGSRIGLRSLESDGVAEAKRHIQWTGSRGASASLTRRRQDAHHLHHLHVESNGSQPQCFLLTLPWHPAFARRHVRVSLAGFLVGPGVEPSVCMLITTCAVPWDPYLLVQLHLQCWAHAAILVGGTAGVTGGFCFFCRGQARRESSTRRCQPLSRPVPRRRRKPGLPSQCGSGRSHSEPLVPAKLTHSCARATSLHRSAGR